MYLSYLKDIVGFYSPGREGVPWKNMGADLCIFGSSFVISACL